MFWLLIGLVGGVLLGNTWVRVDVPKILEAINKTKKIKSKEDDTSSNQHLAGGFLRGDTRINIKPPETGVPKPAQQEKQKDAVFSAHDVK